MLSFPLWFANYLFLELFSSGLLPCIALYCLAVCNTPVDPGFLAENELLPGGNATGIFELKYRHIKMMLRRNLHSPGPMEAYDRKHLKGDHRPYRDNC